MNYKEFDFHNRPSEEEIEEIFKNNNPRFHKIANLYRRDSGFFDIYFQPYYSGGKLNLNTNLICPHCQTKGKVYTLRTTEKAGVSGGKATAALLTGGLSLLATGLSRKVGVTRALCKNCSSQWTF